jgi:polysaccharide export outer membrane protein
MQKLLSTVRSRLVRTVCAIFCVAMASLAVCLAQTADPALKTHPIYTLHPGDVVSLDYRYTPDFNQKVTIQPDGYAELQIVGSVKLAGLTLTQAHDLIVKGAASRLNAPELTLALQSFEEPYVVVAGEVAKPAHVPYREGETALQAILSTGGFTENARAGEVLLFRKLDSENAEVITLKLDRLNHRADLEHDRPLQPGDMIMVPRDRIAVISRYIKLANVGFYFNPLSNIP